MNKTVKISRIKSNPNNPRIIKDDKFLKLVESIKSFPEMLHIRPIVVNKDMVILGGNMRFKACKEAELKEVPIIIAELTEDQEREFIIKEFRLMTEYWLNRLTSKDWQYVTFQLGYAKEAPRLRKKILDIKISTIEHEFFGGQPVDVFEIVLGD